MAEDQIAEWHHQVNAQESEQTPGDSEGQGGLVCYGPWGHKESDMTETEQQQPDEKKEASGHTPSN